MTAKELAMEILALPEEQQNLPIGTTRMDTGYDERFYWCEFDYVDAGITRTGVEGKIVMVT